MKKTVFISIFISVFAVHLNSQTSEPVRWEYESKQLNEHTYEFMMTAHIQGGWRLFGLKSNPMIGKPLKFHFEEIPGFELLADVISDPGPYKEYDEVLLTNTEYYKGSVQFLCIVKSTKTQDIKLTITGQAIKFDKSNSIILKYEHTYTLN